MLIVWLRILTCEMFCSTIDCRWCVQCFPQDLNRLSPFNHLDCSAIHFEEIVIQFPYVSGFRSINDLFIQHCWGEFLIGRRPGQLKHLNKGMLILSDLELPALPYVAPITAISWYQEYQLYYVLEIIWWPCGKMICHSQKYARDH